MNYFQNNLKIEISGMSHSDKMIIKCQGLKNKPNIDYHLIEKNLLLRRGQADISTPRKELDKYEITYVNDELIITVYNENYIDEPFNGLVRPGHADLVQLMKYQDEKMILGGGIASGRLTVLLVILGSIFEAELLKKGIIIKSFIKQIGKIKDESTFNDQLFMKENEMINVIDDQITNDLIKEIKEIQNEQDSIGGIVQTFIKNPIVGLGEPFFNSVESILSHLIFSIPGINGISFGNAYNPLIKGSVYNDVPYFENQTLSFRSNNSAGIQGGLTNGNIIHFTTSIRPIASIKKEQDTINFKTKENVKIQIKTRNDCCIVPRILPVINSCCAITLFDLLLERNKI